jgi:hypothetical protein
MSDPYVCAGVCNVTTPKNGGECDFQAISHAKGLELSQAHVVEEITAKYRAEVLQRKLLCVYNTNITTAHRPLPTVLRLLRTACYSSHPSPATRPPATRPPATRPPATRPPATRPPATRPHAHALPPARHSLRPPPTAHRPPPTAHCPLLAVILNPPRHSVTPSPPRHRVTASPNPSHLSVWCVFCQP